MPFTDQIKTHVAGDLSEDLAVCCKDHEQILLNSRMLHLTISPENCLKLNHKN